MRLWVCLLGSYYFYGYWDYHFLLLILFLLVSNFYLVKKIYFSKSKLNNKIALLSSIFISLFTLGFFKYYNFFIDSLNLISVFEQSGSSFSSLHIILPVGISFYTFQGMSYTIDVYRGKVNGEQSWLCFCTYIAFSPQLVAGSIVRASDLLPQLKKDQLFLA